MVLELTITRSLHEAERNGDADLVTRCYGALQEALARTTTTTHTDLENLIYCAEVAIKCNLVDISDRCCQQYERSFRHYSLTAGLSNLEPRDQLTCRWDFARARVLSARTRTLKGKDLVEGTLKAVGRVMDGLKVALESDRYKFLVYNASVHLWHVSRPLQRVGLRAQLAEPFHMMIQALAKVPEQHSWKARLLSMQALCQYEAGRAEEALASLQEALDAAKKASDQKMIKEITQIRAHMGQMTGRIRPDVDAAAPVEEQAAQVLQLARSGNLWDPATAEKQLNEILVKIDPPGVHGAKRHDINFSLVAEISWTASALGLNDLANKCSNRAQGAQDLGPRLRADLALVLMDLKHIKAVEEKKGAGRGAGPGPGSLSLASEVVTVWSVNARVALVKKLETTLNAMLRLEDASGIQDGSVLAWNVALPLLQPNLRHHVARLFTIAAKALRAVDSPLHRLRTQFHLESAKCSLGTDLVSAAYQDTLAGLSLDYQAKYPEEVERTGYERPMDRYLVPLCRSLALKTNPYAEPEDPEEQALLYLERAKDAKMSSARLDALQRAIKALKTLPHPKVDYSGPTEARQAAELRALLWGEITKVAWQHRLDQVVLDAARYAVEFNWKPSVSKERTVLQAEILFLQAEAAAQALKNRNVQIEHPTEELIQDIEKDEQWLAAAQSPPTSAPSGDQPLPPGGTHAEPAPLPTSVQELQKLIPMAVLKGMGLGLAVKEPWLVMNGAAYAWNNYRHLADKQMFLELLPLLRMTMDRLMRATVEEPVDQPGSELPPPSAAGGKAPPPPAKGGKPDPKAKGKPDPKKAPPPAPVAVGGVQPIAPQRAPEMVEKEAYVDPHMLAAIGQALLSGMEHDYLKGKFPEFGTLLYRDLIIKASSAPIGCGKDSESLKTAAELGRKVLFRLGEDMAPPRSFVEVYSRVLSLLGQPLAATGDVASTREKTGQVVAAIGLVSRTDVSRDEKEKALKQALDNLAELSQGKEQKDVELWAKLAQAALSAGFIAEALHGCIEATELPEGLEPDDIELPEDLPELSSKDWYYMSVAELVAAQAVIIMAQSGQDGMSAAKLKRLSLTHCGHAAKFGFFCKRRDAVELAARTLWNAAIDFLSSPLSRGSIARPLSHICQFVRQVGVGDMELALRLHVTLCDAMFNAKRYADGLLEVQNACNVIPVSMHRDLLKWKVVFQSRLGKNVEAEMLRVADYPKETQADVWLALALQSRSRYDQLIARHKAVDVLAGKPWKQAEFLLGIGEWLLLKEGEVTYGREVLQGAADILLKIDGFNVEAPEEVEGPPSIANMSNVAKSMRRSFEGTISMASGGRQSILGHTESRRISLQAAPINQASGGGSDAAMPRVQSISPYRLNPGKSDAAALLGDKTDAAKQEEEFGKPTELSVLHMNMLLRIFCLLATSAKQTSERVSFLISAQIMATRMLSSSAEVANTRAAVKRGPIPPNPDGSIPPSPSAVSLPKSLLQYAYFQWPKEATVLLAEQNEEDVKKPKIRGVEMPYMYMCREAIPAPELTLHYLGYMVEQLAFAGFHMHALPLCHVYAAVVELAMAPRPGSKDVRPINHATIGLLKLASVLDQVGLSEEARKVEFRAGTLMLTPDEVAAARSEVEQRQIAQAAMQERSYGFKRLTGFSPPPTRGGSEAGDNKDEKKKKDEKGERGFSGLLLMAARAEAADQQLGLGVRPINPMAYHEAWLQRAMFFIERGQYGPAAEILQETIYCARGFNDDDAAVKTRLLQAKLALFVSDPQQSLAHLKEADKWGGDLEMWREFIEVKAKALAMQKSASIDTRSQALDLLHNATESIQNMFQDMPLLDLQILLAQVMAMRNDMVLENINRELREGTDSDLTVTYNQLTQSMQKQMHILKMCGGGLPYIKTVMKYAEVLLLGIEVLNTAPSKTSEPNDHRPRVRQVIALLTEAEKELRATLQDQLSAAGLGRASRTQLTEQDPQFAPVASKLQLESQRLLSSVLVRLAHASIQLARLNDSFLAKDRAQARPRFPHVPHKEAKPVEFFLDDLDEEEQREEQMLMPGGAKPSLEVQALAHAQAALDLCQDAPFARAQAAANEALGATMLYIHEKEMAIAKRFPPEPGRAASIIDASAALSGGGLLPGQPAPPPPGPPPPQPRGSANPAAAAAVKKEPGPPQIPAHVLEGYMTEPLSPQLSQALRHLNQSLTDAQQARDLVMAQSAAERLIEAYQQVSRDQQSPFAARAFEMLLLAQSCRAARELKDLYRKASDRRGLDLLMTRQLDSLEALCARPEDNAYWKHCTETFAGLSPIPKVLSVNVHPWQILNPLPVGTAVAVLHMSSTVPGMFIAGLFIKGPNSPNPDAPAQDRVVIRTVAAPGLMTLVKTWANLIKVTEISLVNAQSLKRPAADSSPGGPNQVTSGVSFSLGRTNSTMTSATLRLGAGRTAQGPEEPSVLGFHLNPLWATVRSLLEQCIGPATYDWPEIIPQSSTLILLTDWRLMELPVEATRYAERAASVARDFSGHVLYSRLTRLSGKPDVPLVVPDTGVPAFSTAELSYVVDPRSQDDPEAIPGRRGGALPTAFKEQARVAQFSGDKWQGVLGDGVAVAGEEEVRQLLCSSKALIYLDVNRLSAHVLPQNLSTIDLSSLRVMVCLDRAFNDAVMRRQTALDVKKLAEDLECERPRELAALLTLRGVQSLIMPCAPSLADVNLSLVRQILEAMKKEGVTIGRALKSRARLLKTDVDVAKSGIALFGLPFLRLTDAKPPAPAAAAAASAAAAAAAAVS